MVLSVSGRGVRTGDKDKQEIRKKWNNLYEKGMNLRRTFFPLQDAQEMLDEAYTLPPYVNLAGDDLGDRLKLFLGELLKDVMTSRNWVASLRDAVFSRNMTLQSINKLMDSASQLRVTPKEVQQFQEFLDEAKDLSHVGQKYLNSKKKIELSDLSDLLRRIHMLPIIIPETKDLEKLYDESNSLSEKINQLIITSEVVAHIKPRSVDSKALVLRQLRIVIIEFNLFSLTNKGKEIAANMYKISLSEANELLTKAQNFSIQLPKLSQYAALVESGTTWRLEVINLTGIMRILELLAYGLHCY